jgi:hypothetical protein
MAAIESTPRLNTPPLQEEVSPTIIKSTLSRRQLLGFAATGLATTAIGGLLHDRENQHIRTLNESIATTEQSNPGMDASIREQEKQRNDAVQTSNVLEVIMAIGSIGAATSAIALRRRITSDEMQKPLLPKSGGIFQQR